MTKPLLDNIYSEPEIEGLTFRVKRQTNLTYGNSEQSWINANAKSLLNAGLDGTGMHIYIVNLL